MNNEKSNCCDTETTDCNTEGVDCCSTDGTPIAGGSYKKKVGLGVLLLAVTFAVASAFSMDTASEQASCSTDTESCATACAPSNAGSSCCAKK